MYYSSYLIWKIIGKYYEKSEVFGDVMAKIEDMLGVLLDFLMGYENELRRIGIISRNSGG